MKYLHQATQRHLEKKLQAGLLLASALGLGLWGIIRFKESVEVHYATEIIAKIGEWEQWSGSGFNELEKLKIKKEHLNKIEIQQNEIIEKAVPLGEFMAAFRLEDEWMGSRGKSVLFLSQARQALGEEEKAIEFANSRNIKKMKACALQIKEGGAIGMEECNKEDIENLKSEIWRGWRNDGVKEMRISVGNGEYKRWGDVTKTWNRIRLGEVSENSHNPQSANQKIKNAENATMELKTTLEEVVAYQKEVDRALAAKKEFPKQYQEALRTNRDYLLKTQIKEEEEALRVLEEERREGAQQLSAGNWGSEDFEEYQKDLDERAGEIKKMHEFARQQIEKDYQILVQEDLVNGEWDGVGSNDSILAAEEPASSASQSASTARAYAGGSHLYWIPSWTNTMNNGGSAMMGAQRYSQGNYLSYLWGSKGASSGTMGLNSSASSPNNMGNVNKWGDLGGAYDVSNPKSHANGELSRMQSFRALKNSIMAKNGGTLSVKADGLKTQMRQVRSAKVTARPGGSSTRVSSYKGAGMGGRSSFGG